MYYLKQLQFGTVIHEQIPHYYCQTVKLYGMEFYLIACYVSIVEGFIVSFFFVRFFGCDL